MLLPTDTTFHPDDGTPVGQALGDLNALITGVPRTPETGFVRVAVFFGRGHACVDVLDADGAPLDPPADLVALEGSPPAATIAELVAAHLIAEGAPDGDAAEFDDTLALSIHP